MTAPTVGLLVLAFVAGVLARSVWDAVGRWRRARRFAGEWDAETDELREYLARHHAVTERGDET